MALNEPLCQTSQLSCFLEAWIRAGLLSGQEAQSRSGSQGSCQLMGRIRQKSPDLCDRAGALNGGEKATHPSQLSCSCCFYCCFCCKPAPTWCFLCLTCYVWGLFLPVFIHAEMISENCLLQPLQVIMQTGERVSQSHGRPR